MKNYKYSVFTSVIEEHIRKGILKHGDRLPSIRKIKKEYQLSSSSVQSGYDDLIFKGLVKSKPGSGYLVNVKIIKRAVQDFSKLDDLPRNAVFREHLILTSHNKNYDEAVSLNAAVPSDILIPQKLILRTMKQTIWFSKITGNVRSKDEFVLIHMIIIKLFLADHKYSLKNSGRQD